MTLSFTYLQMYTQRKCFLFFFPGNAERKIKSLVCMYFDCLVQFACVIIASTGHGSLVFLSGYKTMDYLQCYKSKDFSARFLTRCFQN